MEYEVTGIVPLHPLVVQYKEDGEEKEDMFFLSPENGALIPAFGEGEGPQEPEAFGEAFKEGWKKFLDSKRNTNKILRPVPPSGTPGAGQGQNGIVLPS